VSDPTIFLHAFGQTLAAMALYPEGHPARERAVDLTYEALTGLTGTPSFTFLEGEVVYGREPLRDFKDWDWGHKLAAAGIERLQVERTVSRDEFEGFLQEVFARVTSTVSTAENRQLRSLGIRFGSVGIQGVSLETAPVPVSTAGQTSLAEEVETLQWLQDEVQRDRAIPLIEAEAIVRSLSVAMHAERRTVLPLLQLKQFDQYTTTHSLNVSVLAMGLAEAIGCRKKEVRALGVAGLLHDIGKTKIPVQILTKPGKLSAEERRLINKHPVDGARMILQSDDTLDVAAVVAYEHHIMLDGGGYPVPHYGRETSLASRLVHVCDVFDALRTKRPYRDAWDTDTVFGYLLRRSGTEFDPELVKPFLEMMHRSELQISALAETPRGSTQR
jgi:putative nucleotidyltransferase with HDIG domain